MSTRSSLAEQAAKFAQELTATIRATVEMGCPDFEAALVGERVAVRQTPASGIVLTVGGAHLVTLTAIYWFDWDRAGQFLAVHESSFKIYADPDMRREPLFRYEFERGGAGDIPNAHIHVHGHRDALAYVMTMAGRTTARGRRRAQAATHSDWPAMADLHLPVGGDRFRPALEDILQLLIEELGVDCQDGWRAALANGRQRWRELQTASVVRDSPDIAASVLHGLGYAITPPADGHPPGQPHRLTDM